jgi:hypothetical protein
MVMNAVPFDTLKLARDLESAGMAPPAAAGAASALADALAGAELATKSDLALLEARVMAAIELLRRDMTIKLGGMMFIAVGVILAAMRLMPHP